MFACRAWVSCISRKEGHYPACSFPFFGLSAFFDLFQIANNATIGYGLWFITIIIFMYLIFPMLEKIFIHKNGFYHLIILIFSCTIASFVIYGMSSVLNVSVSFSIGVYLSSNGKINNLINSSIMRSFLYSLFLIIVLICANMGIFPYFVRNLLFAFYPYAFVPLFFLASWNLPPSILAASGFFASLSYEFYILHFYFINEHFTDFFPASSTVWEHILISFVATLAVSYIISRSAAWFRKLANRYLLSI